MDIIRKVNTVVSGSIFFGIFVVAMGASGDVHQPNQEKLLELEQKAYETVVEQIQESGGSVDGETGEIMEFVRWNLLWCPSYQQCVYQGTYSSQQSCRTAGRNMCRNNTCAWMCRAVD